MTKKEEAFKLFDEGKTALSPEVRALKLKGKTRYNYYLQYKEERGITDSSIGESKGKGRIISELEMVAPPDELNGDELEVSEEEEVEEPAGESEGTEKRVEKKAKETDGRKPIPTIVAGQGLWFNIQLSTKTIQLYQIAASMQTDELTIGDFIDTCVEDFYRGRGYDLGLVKITGGQNE